MELSTNLVEYMQLFYIAKKQKRKKESKRLLKSAIGSLYLNLTLSIHSAFLVIFMCRATAASQHLWQEENMGFQPPTSFLPSTRYHSRILPLLGK